MELDDLKTAWREMDRRLDAAVSLNLRLLTEQRVGRAQSALRPLAVLLAFEVATDVGAVLLAGSFLGENLHAARFAVPGAALLVAAVLAVVAAVRQLELLRRIDYAAPVVAIQRALTVLRGERVRTARATLLLAPLLWTPLAVVAARGLLGVDLVAAFGPAWVAANLAFGAAVLVGAQWVARRHAARLEASPALARLADALAGRSVARARRALDEVAAFEAA